MTLIKEWLLTTISELEEERDATPGVVNEDAAMALAAMKLALASLEAEAVAQVLSSRAGNDTSTIDKALPEGTMLYTAPPAPVSVPAALENDIDSDDHPLLWSYNNGWNACRAAMLQGVEPVKTAYKLRDAVEIIRNSGIEIDAEKIFAERDALNAPDCWCRTCRPITLTDMRFVVCPVCGNKRCPHANDHRNACTGSNEPGQEGSAYPAAPQQEAE
ncbi:TPA: hypothetical protein RJ957_000545 [Enterobacter hormaechei]|nr:hypothetical protein [Enterobacter hormaechei]